MTEAERIEQARRELQMALSQLEQLNRAHAHQNAVNHTQRALLLLTGTELSVLVPPGGTAS